MNRLFSPAFWVGFTMVVGMMGTALITPLYGIYRNAWNLRPSDITLTYVVYMLGALFGLLALGRLPDKLSHRLLLIGAIATSTLGTLLSMLASGLSTFLVARFLVGVAASLITIAGATALRDTVSETRKPKVPLILSLIFAAGFGVGPLIGGAIGQFAGNPLVIAFWPSLACGAIALFGLIMFFPERDRATGRVALQAGDFIPRLTLPEPGRRLWFVLNCGAPLMGFTAFGFYASMSPLFVEATLHMTGPIVSGTSFAAFLVLSALLQLVIQRFDPGVTIPAGFVALALSYASVMINLDLNSPLIFAAGVVLTAFGHGCVVLGSMQRLTRGASSHNLSALTSTYMVVGYLSSVMGSLGLGWLANHLGVGRAVFVFGGVVIAICMVLTALTILFRRVYER
ncbi:MFS transporter [Nitratireductor aestuarii]|uniref:MFS transporter n=1 Tax=Nitratireductor aestuarii TaxID=1735103 RepID=A0A916W9Q2_9HYPH|nr:MFS transporter [Nitratireductor aestuarii]GGA78618.1 MFS transporter [Nitratireductor aestuarii]